MSKCHSMCKFIFSLYTMRMTSQLKEPINQPGLQFNIKISSYQYRKSHFGDETVGRSYYLYNGISYTGKMASLYWISPLWTICSMNQNLCALQCNTYAQHCDGMSSAAPLQNDMFLVYFQITTNVTPCWINCVSVTSRKEIRFSLTQTVFVCFTVSTDLKHRK